MNKIESIRWLADHGFNCSLTVEIISHKPPDIKQAIAEFRRKLPEAERVSIRTERPAKRSHSPFFYRIPFNEVEEKIISLPPGCKAFLSETLNAEDSIACGRILIEQIQVPRHLEFKLEALLGSGTVIDLYEYQNLPAKLKRKLNNRIVIEMKKSYEDRFTYNSEQLPFLGELLHQTRKIGGVSDWLPVVVEFSYYPYSVGIFQKNLIFWEVIEIGKNRNS